LGPRAGLNGCGKSRHHPYMYINMYIHTYTHINNTLYFPLLVPDRGDRFR